MSEAGRRGPSAELNYAARAARRAGRLVVHRATSFQAADEWDLDFWQSRTPAERLSAFVHLRHDVEMVQAARTAADPPGS